MKCEVVPVTTYDQRCTHTEGGGAYDVTCTYKAVTTNYTYCDDSPPPADGGGYPPAGGGGGGGYTPAFNAFKEIDSQLDNPCFS